MSEYPEGLPDESWTHDEIDAWAEAHNVHVEGTKAEKLVHVTLAFANETEEDPVVEVDPVADSEPGVESSPWERGGLIPSGATGPTVDALRRRLGIYPVEGSLDRGVVNRVRRFQAASGLPQTGRVDSQTRALLGI